VKRKRRRTWKGEGGDEVEEQQGKGEEQQGVESGGNAEFEKMEEKKNRHEMEKEMKAKVDMQMGRSSTRKRHQRRKTRRREKRIGGDPWEGRERRSGM
jgi:hypothetical protein